MTKKSVARQTRDALKKDKADHLKDNTIWDDLNATYSACSQALGQHTAIAAMLQRKEVFPYLRDSKATVANISSVTRDLIQLNSELKEIYAQHKDNKGGSDDPDDVIRSLQIYEQYQLFLQRHDAVIMPAVYHILEDFGQAEKAFNQATGVGAVEVEQERTDAERAADPNDTDPIDVSFTEIPATPIQ